ncbi:MAG: hypothetical protein AAFX80_08950 [Cyanobacteria bacterium J06639_18]
MATGDWGLEIALRTAASIIWRAIWSSLPITNYPLPITHYPSPITHYPLPIPNPSLQNPF